MKAKIIKSTLPSYWYADKIGEIFEVTDYDDKFFVKDNGFVIDKDDCSIIEDDYEILGNRTDCSIDAYMMRLRRVNVLLKASKDSRLAMQKRLNEKCNCIDRLKAEIVDLKDKLNNEEIIVVEKLYDEFFGTGYWEKQYKQQIVIFAEKCIAEAQNNKKIKCDYGIE